MLLKTGNSEISVLILEPLYLSILAFVNKPTIKDLYYSITT